MVVPALIYVAGQPRRRRRRAARLGDPDRDRHRVRARGARGDQHPPAHRAAHLPAHPRRGRRPARDHDHRGLLHRRPATWLPLLLALVAAGGRSRSCVQRADPVRGGCCCRWRWRPGRWCTPPACTPPSPGCCSGSPSRWCAASRRRARRRPGLAEHFEHRFRPISAGFAVPVFAFFAAGVTVGGLERPGDALTRPGRARASSPGWWSARPSGSLGATWLVARFTRAELDEDLGWVDVARAGAARRHRVHRLAADRRARLRRRQRARRPRQGRRPDRLGGRRAARPRWCSGVRNRTYRRIEERADG